MEAYTTMTEAVEGLKSRGFSANFEVVDDKLQSMESGQQFVAEDLVLVEHHRFEGITNPSDESIVYAIESKDGTRGVLVDAYGTYADPAVSALVKKIEHSPAG